ncbi:pyridoxamine 5'-phosphate oxidase family protein [Mucilaginibacter sp. Bleaf8]|uniref:pyridoxamine 5'-phosphate oxidase family protein n=1 Tax=Mucilaginibacter sp. Bleaf8 TaxID=2834430 RepID=UPI001BCF8680|nr:pyridoxamine 5'-phosphate oxidase family protein [Mucilaginibacter sp. Bleaf8]MBS7566515.1 pyridoxamine 5'-phosphate oxidase family protein [Mucilaginibacter sp. Bleaf8]
MNVNIRYILDNIWQVLKTASTTPGHNLRNITVAHYADSYVSAYTVVLRAASATRSSIAFFTDYRSPKIKHIKANPNITVCGYDTAEKIQLILQGKASIHFQNDVAKQYWKKEGRKSRQSYMAKPAPSTVIAQESDGLDDFRNKNFDEQDTAGYENFAVIEIQLHQLEYLHLSHEGNRRAQFTMQPDGDWQGNWLIP